MTRIETLVLIHQKSKILLAMKKQRFGKGRYNGFGGGQEEGESIMECAIRETYEEGKRVSNLIYMGKVLFRFIDSDEQDHEVHIYKAEDYDGEPTETEEMKPVWYEEDQIPYNEMWAGDIHWIPLFLRNQKFTGEFHFSEEGLAHYELNEVEEIK